MNYLEWNDAIAAHFFRSEMADRRVFLAVTDDVLEEIGKPHGVGRTDFLKAIRSGPPWAAAEPDICKKALLIAAIGRQRNLNYPPYIAYLAVFVLAATGQDGFGHNAFYAPLSSLLNQTITINQFKPTYTLWLNLRKWCNTEKQRELGFFRSDISPTSAFVNVGLPRSQTLLLSSERAELPVFFADNHLDPTSLPSEAALLRALRSAKFLRPATQQLLMKSDASSQELQAALVGFVRDELQVWDGTVKTHDKAQGKAQIRVSSNEIAAVLRLCLNVTKLANRATLTARFKANHPFPDETLHFRELASDLIWLGRETQDGWSKPLFQGEGKQKITLDAVNLDWKCGQSFRDAELGWRISFPPATVRLFLPGRREGLDEEWIEASHLVPGSQFCVACTPQEAAEVESWGKEQCESFQALSPNGLPPGWTLFRAGSARKSHPTIDLLKLPTSRRLRLVGGIKAEGRHTYFHFDRPCVTLEGGSGGEPIKCTQSELEGDADGLWHFSNTVPTNTPLKIECGEESLMITLVTTELRLNYEPPTLDVWGTLAKGSGVVRGVEAPEEKLEQPEANIPTHFGGHIVFLGRRAGEIADWPSDPLPQNWQPLWAIVKLHKDHWQAHFVGSSPEFSTIRQSKPADRRVWRDWKNIYTRHTTEVIGMKRIRDFWNQCRKEANQL